ncbi:MAG: PQQ-dependent sugar dehydrogenase [Sphaerobacter sp.]|nr:PQQ-dependent sugar dehydrogenase [Sphaerobacter sp.]
MNHAALGRWRTMYLRLLAAALLLAVGAAACEAGAAPGLADPSQSASTGAAASTSQPAAPNILAGPTESGTPTTEPPRPAQVAYAVETFVAGLEIPWELRFLPDGRIFVTERRGRVRVIENGQLRPEPVATIAEVAHAGEGGLLGMALDPDFANNHWLYLYYTYATGGGLANRVVRYTEAGNTLVDPVVILDGIPGAEIHDGGRIAFGPDGKLYITAGDASQEDLAQDLNSLAGKILRLNPDGSVPADNPFPGSPIYSYGHRNPEGLAWQPGTNTLYATEHGPAAHDEVNLIQPRANYGWPDMVGNEGPQNGYTPPVIESGDATWAPAGATFVQGGTFPQWTGSLLFASLRGEALWWLNIPAGGNPPPLEAIISGDLGRLRNVVEGPDGYLYILTNNRDGRGDPAPDDDRILRIVPQP